MIYSKKIDLKNNNTVFIIQKIYLKRDTKWFIKFYFKLNFYIFSYKLFKLNVNISYFKK